jgi:hypothetical protein
MTFQYGKTIKDKISAEKNGEISGVGCNVFDLSAGKDFVLLVKEIQTGDETYPDYKMSMFKPETTSLPIYFKDKGVFKNAPLGSDGKVEATIHGKIREFLTDREHNLEDFAPKKLEDAQQGTINEIIGFLTGKSTQSFVSSKSESKPTSGDFDFEESMTSSNSSPSTDGDDDDFFKDF